MNQSLTTVRTRCCISGGGPAGVMLGFLLARAGVDVVVLEKHGDFLRDFRGDTIHPSTLEVVAELGLMAQFRPLLQNEIRTLDVVVGGTRITPVDFGRLRGDYSFMGLMPQWDFLDFLTDKGRRYPGFHLVMDAEVGDLLWQDGRVTGVRASTPQGPLEVTAELTVGADGRDSVVRRRAGMAVREFGVAIDVLWFRLPKPADAPPPTLAYLAAGEMVLTIDRGDYYQGGMVVPKGGFDRIRAEGLPRLRARLVAAAPRLAGVTDVLTDWEQVKLLSVQVNRLRRWDRPGLLCIGDAAHAMSPAFGVGVNYAIQDAIAAANLLAEPLKRGRITAADVARVQRRRELPVRLMQPIQVLLHRAISRPGGPVTMFAGIPAPVRAVGRVAQPVLQTLAARLIGRGFRPEHVHTPERASGA